MDGRKNKTSKDQKKTVHKKNNCGMNIITPKQQ